MTPKYNPATEARLQAERDITQYYQSQGKIVIRATMRQIKEFFNNLNIKTYSYDTRICNTHC